MDLVYQRESNLDEESNFTVEICEKNIIDRKGKIYWWK